ncbi:sugar ABC transporter substrate-binding protein [Salipaludibacillus sp. HK11]|uniref:sugar ABC transporter substrate-binding protein n=1 Tax=Salipaludibacillus sp. HK11 TaxID=3394320 RepID=UPI0039FD12EA
MKMLFPMAACLVLLTITVSCKSVENNQEDLNTQSVNDIETSTTNEEKLTFAIVYPVAHPFFELVTLGAREMVENIGEEVDIVVRAPNVASVEEQLQIMDSLIKQNVDGIAIGPTDSAILTPFINKAIDAGINVICFDTDAPESNRVSYIGTDNLSAGEHLGEVVAEALDYEGAVIVSSGLSTMLNLNTRIDGVIEKFKEYPDIEIMDIRYSDGNPSKTLTNIEEMVDEFPEFDALIGIDSLSGPAAVTVWKAKGLQEKSVITFDDLPMILDGIENNHITSTISQSQYTWGELIIESLYDSYLGEDIAPYQITETIEVNSTNIDEYLLTAD